MKLLTELLHARLFALITSELPSVATVVRYFILYMGGKFPLN